MLPGTLGQDRAPSREREDDSFENEEVFLEAWVCLNEAPHL